MAYVEWLRVKKTLSVLGIVLGAIFLIMVVVRIGFADHLVVSRMQQHAASDIGVFFGISVIFACIIATVLATPLARENERLEVAWTKPVDRDAYALQLYLADVVGICASVFMFVIFMLAVVSLFGSPNLTITPVGWWRVAMAFAVPIAWYAMFAGATTWMKRGFGAILGVAWPAALIVPGLAMIPVGDNQIGLIFHWVFQTIAVLDPLAYVHLNGNLAAPSTGGLAALAYPIKIGILAVLTIVYAGAGLIEWRRVEA